MRTHESTGRAGSYTRISALALAAVILISFAHPRLAYAQTPVSNCGTTLSVPGRYVLTSDLSCFGDAVFITGSHIDLNLNGFTLTGQGAGAGINVGNYCATPTSGVRISKGQVVGFDFGVILCKTTGALVSRLAVRQNVNDGIVMDTANNTTIAGNRITDNGFKGIVVRGQTCDNDQFTANDVSNNAIHGIELSGTCHNNRIAVNNVSNNDLDGIVVRGTGNQILSNRANGNVCGICLRGFNADNNTLRFNETNDNGELGIFIGGFGNVIERNTSRNNVIFDMNDANDAFPSCPNTWRRNNFGTDEDDGGPGVGCIQ